MRNNARLVMLAQQSSSLGICHFTHAPPPKTRLLHIYRKKKNYQQNGAIMLSVSVRKVKRSKN